MYFLEIKELLLEINILLLKKKSISSFEKVVLKYNMPLFCIFLHNNLPHLDLSAQFNYRYLKSILLKLMH